MLFNKFCTNWLQNRDEIINDTQGHTGAKTRGGSPPYSESNKIYSPTKLTGICVQYKSLKVIQNGGKSKKSKTFFVASPIEDLDSFYQKLFPE